MSRFQTLLCVTILLATVTFFNGASAHIKIKPALPQIGDPTTVNDVESYTVKVVSTFVAELEKECPKTEKFKHFFEKVNAYSKYACAVSNVKDSKSEMKAKAGSLFQAVSDLGSSKNASKGGKMSKSLKKEKSEAMDTVKMLQSIGEKIGGGKKNKTEINGTKKLTVEQQKEIKDGMLKWLQVITRIAKTTEETTLQYSSKNQTTRESKEEKSSSSSRTETQTQTKTSSRAAKAGKNDDVSKSDKKSKKKSDNEKKKKGESKKDSKSKKEDGKESGSKEGKSSKSKGEESNKKAEKNHKVSYGKIEPKKAGVEPARNKTAERIKAEMADELD